MRVLGLDIETTGLDIQNDKIIEVGFVVKEFTTSILGRGEWKKKSLNQGSYFIWEDDYPDPMPPEKYAIHSISSELLKEAGRDLETVFLDIEAIADRLKVDCIVAHNGLAFDRPFILDKVSCYAPLLNFFADTPWIDTKVHVEYPTDCASKGLMYLAAYHGFINPFPHDALSDVQTMLKVLAHYDFEKVLARAKEPWIIVKADVSYDDRYVAKARGYSWNAADKRWEKIIPTSDLITESAESPFEVILVAIQKWAPYL